MFRISHYISKDLKQRKKDIFSTRASCPLLWATQNTFHFAVAFRVLCHKLNLYRSNFSPDSMTDSPGAGVLLEQSKINSKPSLHTINTSLISSKQLRDRVYNRVHSTVKHSHDFVCWHCYRPQRSWGKVIFSQASVILSTGGGGGGVRGRGGMRGSGVCMARGYTWQGGMCDAHLPGRYYGYGLRSMSGRYASYWNAFLLLFIFIANFLPKTLQGKD